MQLRYKLILLTAGLILPFSLICWFLVYSQIKQDVEENINKQIELSNKAIAGMARSAADVSIRNYLRAVAETNLDVIRSIHSKSPNAPSAQAAAQRRAADVLTSQSIGSSGYIYCIDHTGLVVVHPKDDVMFIDVSDRDFVQRQIQLKSGYLEYEWQNPDDTEPRAKAMYMAYFEPWDWIISVTAYRDEFSNLVNIDDLKEELQTIELGAGGYPFILDLKGNVLLHPALTGEIANLDEQTEFLFREFMERRHGIIAYQWPDPVTGIVRPKRAFLETIDSYGWLIGSSVYLDEFYKPIEQVRRVFLIAAAAAVLLAAFVSVFLAEFLSRPLKSLLWKVEHDLEEQGLPVPASVETSDEIASISSRFAIILAHLQRYSEELESEIAERMRAESNLSITLYSIGDAVIATDINGFITRMNKNAEELTGYPQAEAQGLQLNDVFVIFNSIDGKPCTNPVDTVLSTGDVCGLANHTVLRSRNGTERHIADSGSPIRDEIGDVIGVVLVFRDITEQYHQDMRIRQSEVFLRAVLESIQDGISVLNPDLSVRLKNKAMDKLCAFDNLGDGVLCTGCDKTRRRKNETCTSMRAMENGQVAMDVVAGPPGTDREWLELTCHPFFDEDDKAAGVVEIVRNITDQRRFQEELLQAKEAAETANAAKSEFLANMSHELRTPLNGVMGMQQLLNTTELDAEQQEYVDATIATAKRLTVLLSDLLDLSRIESGVMRIESKPFDPAETLHDMQQLFQPTCEQKGLSFSLHADTSLPALVRGDQTRLQQVLINLVVNAVKFTEAGEITLEASMPTSAVETGGRILFIVSDTGIGISDNQLHRLFEPFTQAGEGYTRNFQGAGLGLSICKRLVSMMGGSIDVESEVGRGTTFYVSIPFDFAAAPDPISSDDAGQAAPSMPALRALLAEDDADSRDMMLKMLNKLGCLPVAVEDGRQALDALQQQDFDVVLMDIQMPVMDGVEATSAIRNGEAGEANASLPIIALTAYAMTGDKETFLDAGMNGYLAKPIDMRELTKLLHGVKGESPDKTQA